MNAELRALLRQFPQGGRLAAIVLRPARGAEAVSVGSALALVERGLEGDRSAERPPSHAEGNKRQVTLIQAEHLPLVAAWVGREAIDAKWLRRNLVVRGINLLAVRSPLPDQALRLRIGDEVILEITGTCDPCSKMEQVLGTGGYNAMRGHGGVTARVLRGGRLAVGESVTVDTPLSGQEADGVRQGNGQSQDV